MSTWLERMEAAIAAGEKPAYADIEEGLLTTLKDLDTFKEITRSMGGQLAAIVLPRINNDTPAVLAAVDDVIKKNVIVKVQDKAALH